MIVRINCSNCVWYGTEQCDGFTEENEWGCSYYPIVDEVSDEEAELLVEEGRKEYADAWRRYIQEDVF